MAWRGSRPHAAAVGATAALQQASKCKARVLSAAGAVPARTLVSLDRRHALQLDVPCALPRVVACTNGEGVEACIRNS